jgi:hypothetical protein
MISHTLKKPVEHGGTTYSDLSFREAETGDLMLADKFEGELSKTVVVLAAMAGIPLGAFQKIKARELNTIIDKTRELLGNEEESTTGD